MPKARSPEYPAIGLKEALERVKLVYDKDYQNRLPKKVIAEHMGYKSLSGTSLPVLAALNKYGLLEGRGDETRVSDRALAIIAHDLGSPERVKAILEAAGSPELFAELNEKFPNGKASDSAIRSYLLTEKFIPEAADTAIRSYRETKQLVESETVGYTWVKPKPPEQPATMPHVNPTPKQTASLEAALAKVMPSIGQPPVGMRQAVFPLLEGDVTLSFPAAMSSASAKALASYITLFLEQARLQAEGRERWREEHGREADED
jgi:hypothetical protein